MRIYRNTEFTIRPNKTGEINFEDIGTGSAYFTISPYYHQNHNITYTARTDVPFPTEIQYFRMKFKIGYSVTRYTDYIYKMVFVDEDFVPEVVNIALSSPNVNIFHYISKYTSICNLHDICYAFIN